MTKLLSIIQSIKIMIQKLYNISPFCIGLVVGYILHPEIKLTLDVIKLIIKGL